MDTVNDFLVKTYKPVYNTMSEIRPRIVCADGFTLSVQASNGHYCSPRVDYSEHYETVEVGYPSSRPPETWREYFDGEWQETGIFGYIARIIKNWSSIWYGIKTKDYQYAKRFLSFSDNSTDSVYGYVPTDLVNDCIESHGGIDWEKTVSK